MDRDANQSQHFISGHRSRFTRSIYRSRNYGKLTGRAWFHVPGINPASQTMIIFIQQTTEKTTLLIISETAIFCALGTTDLWQVF